MEVFLLYLFGDLRGLKWCCGGEVKTGREGKEMELNVWVMWMDLTGFMGDRLFMKLKTGESCIQINTI